MKHIWILLACLMLAAALPAQDRRIYWKYKDYDGAIPITLPGFVLEIGSLFLDEDDGRELVQHLTKVRALVFTDGDPSPVTVHDIERFNRRARSRNMEELLTIRSGKVNVRVWGKTRRNWLRKLVVLVQSPEAFVLLSLKGYINIKSLAKMLEGADLPGQDEMPQKLKNLKIPVHKI